MLIVSANESLNIGDVEGKVCQNQFWPTLPVYKNVLMYAQLDTERQSMRVSHSFSEG